MGREDALDLGGEAVDPLRELGIDLAGKRLEPEQLGRAGLDRLRRRRPERVEALERVGVAEQRVDRVAGRLDAPVVLLGAGRGRVPPRPVGGDLERSEPLGPGLDRLVHRATM